LCLFYIPTFLEVIENELFISSSGASAVYTDRVSVFMMEGDSVTLNTGVKTNQQEKIKWYFNNTRIAQINGDLSKICTDVQCNNDTDRFRDRLKLDHQTGSLTITNTTNTHSGEYKLQIIGSNTISETIFSKTVNGESFNKTTVIHAYYTFSFISVSFISYQFVVIVAFTCVIFSCVYPQFDFLCKLCKAVIFSVLCSMQLSLCFFLNKLFLQIDVYLFLVCLTLTFRAVHSLFSSHPSPFLLLFI